MTVNTDRYAVIGRTVGRIDAVRKVLGKPIYTADLIPPTSLHIKLVKSPSPHAVIKKIDASKAQRVKGVRDVLTAHDIPGVNQSACIIPDRALLAFDRVRCVGDILAAVVAEDEDAAAEAASLVNVEFDPLPIVSSPREAMNPDSIKIHEAGNIVRHLKIRKGDVEKGFNQSDVIIENEYTTQFQDAVPIEPEAGFSRQEQDGTVTFVGSMQNPHYVRGGVARILGLAEDKVRVIQADTGGTFGTKSDEVVIDIAGLTSIACLKARRPVSLVYTREESMIMHSKRHPFTIKHRTGATRDGRLMAAEVEMITDTGAYASNGPLVLTRAIFHSTGPYVIPNVKTDAYCVYTNNTVAGSFRGFGNPQANFAAECQMDAIAAKLGLDPLDLRMKNILRPGATTATSQVLDDSVGLEGCIIKVRASSDWYRKRRTVASSKDRFRKGIGLAVMYHGNSIGPEGTDRATARVMITKEAEVRFRIGLTEYGTGARSGLAQIIAEILGVPVELVQDDVADTATTQDSGGSFASRTTVMGGRAVMAAAIAIRSRLNAVASELLNCGPKEITIQSGIVRRGKSGRAFSFRKLVHECYRRQILLTESSEYTAHGVSFNENTGQGIPYIQYTFGAVVAEVEVDTKLGNVRPLKITTAYDVGKAINPLGLIGQIEGATSQALGYALMEELIHENCVVMNPSLAQYLIPTATDIPEIESYIVERPGKLGPFGAKAMGEPPIVAPAAAVINAIYHAISVQIQDLPARPERILRALAASSPSD